MDSPLQGLGRETAREVNQKQNLGRDSQMVVRHLNGTEHRKELGAKQL